MGKSKKIIFNLTINDLRELGIIRKKRKKGKKGRQLRKRILLIDPQTGAIIGGPKADSSHMVGSTQTLQPSNTNSINTAIQQANLEAIENANKKTKDQRQFLIDNGIDPNDPTINIQPPARFPDRNSTKLLDDYNSDVSNKLGQIYDRFSTYDKTITRGMDFVQQQQNQIEELKKKPFNYSLNDSEGAFGETKGSDGFKSNNTMKSMNEINDTPNRFTPVDSVLRMLRMQTPIKEQKTSSPLIEVIEPVTNESFEEMMDLLEKEKEEDEEDVEYDEIVEELPVVKKASSNAGKIINGKKVINTGRRSIGFAQAKVIAPKSDLTLLREQATELFDRKYGLVDARKFRRMENDIRSGQTKKVQNVIDELNQLGKK